MVNDWLYSPLIIKLFTIKNRFMQNNPHPFTGLSDAEVIVSRKQNKHHLKGLKRQYLGCMSLSFVYRLAAH